MNTRKEQWISQILLDNYDTYYRLAYSYVHQESDAMDIVQEGAYKAIRKAQTLRQEEFAATWIYRIMLNEIFAFLRQSQKMQSEFPEETEGKSDIYEDLDLKQAIEKLAPQEKALVMMRFYEEKSLDEIATIMNVNLSTIKSRLYRTLGKLKIQLSEE